MGLIWEVNLVDFLLVTAFLGGGAAYLTGRAMAITWGSIITLVIYVLLLTCAVRFIHYALFGGTLLSVQFFIIDLIILAFLAAIGFRVTRARQMAVQYSWIYKRSGPLSWSQQPATGNRT